VREKAPNFLGGEISLIKSLGKKRKKKNQPSQQALEPLNFINKN
jgi:hypothetical protein